MVKSHPEQTTPYNFQSQLYNCHLRLVVIKSKELISNVDIRINSFLEVYTIYPSQDCGCTEDIKLQILDIQEQEQYYEVIDHICLLISAS